MLNKLLFFLLLLVLSANIAVAENIIDIDAEVTLNLTLENATIVGRPDGEPELLVVKYADAISYQSLDNATSVGRFDVEPDVMVVKYADAISYQSLDNATSVGRLDVEPDVMVVKYADAISYQSLVNATSIDCLTGEPDVIVVKYADTFSYQSLKNFTSFSGITLNLYTGWNLISLPLMPEDTSITSLMSSISSNYSIVWEYNASDTADHWKKYDPGVPFGNDLTNMEPGKGYWIMMTSDDTLPISGTVPESTDIVLKTSWNLVGFNSLDNKPIAEALSSINGNYSIVWAYDASDTADHWKKYDPGVPFGNDMTDMESRKGYWIMMTSDDIIEI
ncbi:hypothetical protein K8R14_01565 [bacterium]|nr:hypothetical protein [bacterium]